MNRTDWIVVGLFLTAMLIIAGLALVYPTKTSDMIGLSLVALVLVMQKFLPARAASA